MIQHPQTQPSVAPGTLVRAGLLSGSLLLTVTAVDYLSGYEYQFSIFYLVPVHLATWYLGWRWGMAAAVGSVMLSVAGDLASGATYRGRFVQWWNGIITLIFYAALIRAVCRLRSAQRNLEARVVERTSELRNEIVERQRVESALLDVSEREQRRIGHDIHDGLGQHLTSAAIACEVLTQKLRAKGLSEAADAEQVVALIEDGIGLARSLARGLSPVDLDVLGLVMNLRELARNTSARTRISCTLEMVGEAAPCRIEGVVQLFRIAQEAVSNAAKHSGGSSIQIRLLNLPNELRLSVEDNGCGIPAGASSGLGMGLRIMQHRAALMSAQFHVSALKPGTKVEVWIPFDRSGLDVTAARA
jgi:signal transduction histidine kinase